MSSERTVAELLADYLRQAGVTHVFGYPGESLVDFIEVARLADALDVFGVAKGAVIDRNGGVVLREAWHLVKPAGVVAAHAVRQHHGGAFTAAFVVELAEPGGDVWHRRPGAETARKKAAPDARGLYTAYRDALANRRRFKGARRGRRGLQKRAASSLM